MTIKLPSTVEAKLVEVATRDGVAPEQLIERLVSDYYSHKSRTNHSAIDLLRSWRDEDTTNDSAELDRRDLETAQLLNALDTNSISLRELG